jgi:hypothetical protein
MGGNREALQTPTLGSSAGRSKKAKGRNVDMHVCRESDGLIVPTKRANKAGAQSALAAESAEGRRATKGQGLWRVRQAVSKERLVVSTRGKSRMREFLTYGSVRGAARKGGPYRD